MAFTHLHLHTEYSLLDASGRIKDMIARGAELGMDSMAITDHGVMYGVIDFYKAAREAGIKPIIGCEVYVAPGSRFDRESSRGMDDERYYHLILLAENNDGYANLTKLVSKGFTEGFYYRPRVDKELLRQYSGGLICLSACLAGEIPRLILRDQYEQAKEAALEFQEIFGKGNYFLELQDHGIAGQRLVNQSLMRMSRETGIELVVTNDVHYVRQQDAQAHDILLCIQTAKTVDDKDRMRYEGDQFYLKPEDEMRELFSYVPDAIERTHEIAMRCNVTIEFGVTKLPKYVIPEGYDDSFAYLKTICLEGFSRRYPDADEELRQRLDYELDVIRNMGYVDYFLIVWDYINYAKTHDIPVGPGRGSAAGSVVSYCMGITDIDPIRYQLLFERFLNPERVSMPDIDVDFCYEKRQQVIDYVVEKYGKDRVAQIITFGTLQARGVIRDVGRALNLPYSKCDMTAKMVPSELGMTLTKALETSRELKDAYDTDPEIKNLIDMSLKLEGLPRHTSMHAAGVVIARENVDEYVPLSKAADGSITTQYTMTALEELGLLKMDFLGLRTLTVINDTCTMVKRRLGTELDMLKIDYDDKAVLDSIGSGHTDGIFQLESAGMQSFMKELKPGSLEDIIAGISLYRPGPMDFIPRYLKGKNDSSSIVYETPQLEHILKPTYGCIVYQEQVMQIVRDLAGYSMGRSDLVRRAMSKKKAHVMDEERAHFVYGFPEEGVPGCVANGIPEDIANHIFDEMTDFARYAFNKSHAACYAYVAYQTAYLKYYYPLEFMAALMTSVMDVTRKVSGYVLTCRQMGIRILPPDINEGYSGFSVAPDASGIRFGLSAIKGVGRSLAQSVVAERECNGLFDSLENFIERMAGTDITKRTVDNFIKAGALDSLDGSRRQKVLIAPEMMDRKLKSKKDALSGQYSLFDIADDESKAQFRMKLPEVDDFTKEERLAAEKDMLGFYLTGHPLEDYQDVLDAGTSAHAIDFEHDDETGECTAKDGMHYTVGGMITDKTVKVTKTGKTMAFVTLEDMTGTLELVVFPGDYMKYNHMLDADAKVLIMGRADISEDADGKLLVEEVRELKLSGREVWIRLEDIEQYQSASKKLYEALSDNEGSDSVVVYLAASRQIKRLDPKWNVTADEGFLEKLRQLFGKANVAVK